ncbi:histidine phosphatase family protein [Paludifilum halophilum]|nr:histidine phosphatase family protein [Paludifilum halophilum]
MSTVSARFFLVRHGDPYWELTEERKMIGVQRDLVPLSETGIAEAESTAKDPRFRQAELILSSPYTRALQTAAIISRRQDLPIQVEYDLHEWIPDLTLSYDSYEKLLALREDFYRCRGEHPKGETRPWETLESVTRRSRSVLERYRRRQPVIVVCHGTVIQSLTGVHDLPHAGVLEWGIT